MIQVPKFLAYIYVRFLNYDFLSCSRKDSNSKNRFGTQDLDITWHFRDKYRHGILNKKVNQMRMMGI